MVRTVLFCFWLAQAASGQKAVFEVASVKPAPPPTGPGLRVMMSSDAGRVNFSNITLINLLTQAYKVKDKQISGPEWLNSERFDIVAKLPEGATKEQIPEMLQALVAERFQLKLHKETKVMPVYALVAGKNGLKLQKADGEAGMRMSMGPKGRQMTGKTTLSRLADVLSGSLDRPVLDMTGQPGVFEIDLSWSADDGGRVAMGLPPGPGPGPSGGEPKSHEDNADGPTIFTALQEKLGLRLDSRKSPVEMLVIDHVEKIPTEN